VLAFVNWWMIMKMLLLRIFLSATVLYYSYQETQAAVTTVILATLLIDREVIHVYIARQRKGMAYFEGMLDTMLGLLKNIKGRDTEEHF